MQEKHLQLNAPASKEEKYKISYSNNSYQQNYKNWDMGPVGNQKKETIKGV